VIEVVLGILIVRVIPAPVSVLFKALLGLLQVGQPVSQVFLAVFDAVFDIPEVDLVPPYLRPRALCAFVGLPGLRVSPLACGRS
jgi:hypothetical protein